MKYTFTLLMLAILVTGPLSFSSLTTGENLATDAFTHGEINGVKYSYGTNTYFASGNHTQVFSDEIYEETTTTITTTENLRLINGVNTTPSEVYYRLDYTYELPERNISVVEWLDMASLEAWADNITTHFFDTWSVQENYTSEEAFLVDQNGEYLATFEMNTTYFEYVNDDYSPLLIPVWGVITPKVVFFDVEYVYEDVEVTYNKITAGYMNFYSEYSLAYNVSATAHQVNITNGENFAVGFNMFDNISANYTETMISWMGYEFGAYEYFDLKYTNGTTVEYENYPLNMYPRSFQTNGSRVDAGYNRVESKILSTYQNVLSAFLTVDAEGDDSSLSIEARLAIWGISTSTTMVAYDDMNLNDRLDLSFSSEGLEVSNDFVSHIGLAEAYSTKVYTAAYSSHNHTDVVQAFGVDINETTFEPSIFIDNFYEDSFGNVDAAVDPVFTWTEPVEEEDGTVVFDFGVTYDDFPVTWINLKDGSVTGDNEDIAYHYIVRVNPETGHAVISTTWTYGGITNPTLAAEMADKSLSLMVKSEFFALRALYTANVDNATINGTTTSAVSRIGARVGNDDATEIDVTGPKQYYTRDGTHNETATFDAIEVLTVAGTFSGERVSPFDSESETTAGTASMSLTETLDVEWLYSMHLLVVNYPTWSGDGLVHDPDYSVTYEKVEEEITDTSDTTTSDTTSDTSDTDIGDPTSTDPTDDPTETPAPGFGLVVASAAIAGIVAFRRRKDIS